MAELHRLVITTFFVLLLKSIIECFFAMNVLFYDGDNIRRWSCGWNYSTL